MELLALRTLKAVVEEGGIKAASLKLHTVQSNITTRIQRLEEELDAALFVRRGRKLELTQSGEILYNYANQMLQLERQATAAVHLAADNYELHIGSPEPFAAVHLPAALQALRRDYSNIIPKVHSATSAELITAVLDHQLDCAFVGGQVEHGELNVIPAVQEEMVVVTSKEQAGEPTLIIRGDGCAYRERALAWQRKTGRSNEETMVMSTVDGLLGCVAAGLGYTVISREMVTQNRYEHSLQLESLNATESAMNIMLIHRKDALPIEAINILAGLFKQPDQPRSAS
ncbi:MAG: LysR family transcriptional regulator [Oceanospirillaceae bacterium]|nr:LysR family transcriptional regulator [Oceanospirillaceae bacterium]